MNKLNFLSLFLFSLIFASVFSFSLDEQNNYWKPAFVNSGYASDDNQVNIYVYYFNQNFNSIESIQAAEYSADVFVEDFKNDSLVDEATQAIVAAGAYAKGKSIAGSVSSVFSPASKFIAKFSTLSIPAGEFTTIKQALEYAEKGQTLAPYMRNALSKYNLVFDDVTGVLKFTDTVEDISIIPKQISFSKGSSLSKVISSLRKATGLSQFKDQMVAYKKVIELRDGVRALDGLSDVEKVAKAKEISSTISKLRNSGALSDDVLKAAGFVNSSGDVGQTLSYVSLKSGNVANNAAKFNAVVASTKPSITSRISAIVGKKVSSAASIIGRGVGKVVTIVGIPTAIGRSAAEITLAANLPDVAAPMVDVFRYSDDEFNEKIIGAEVVIDPQFGLNVQRYKAMREELDKSIDEMGGLANGAWEVLSFFDPTELGWLVAEKLPALNSLKEEFIIENNGCTISVITNVPKEKVDDYINAQSEFICLITDVTEEKAKSQLFLPKGNYMIIANSKMTQKMVDKVVDAGSLLASLPKPIRERYNQGEISVVKDYLINVGFPSLPTMIEVTDPILLSSFDSDSLSLQINFSSGKTILDYFKTNALSDINIDSFEDLKNKIKFYSIKDGNQTEVILKELILNENKLKLILAKGLINVDGNYRLFFDIPMKEGLNKLSISLNNITKVN